jgi:hypothetical protein
MQQRGRKGTGSLVAAGGAVSLVQRPEPDLSLTPEESDVWQRTVDAMPADWFPAETHPLLTQWCRHTVAARRVAQLIDAAMSRDDLDVGEMKELLGLQGRESAALKALAASMRISQQASYSARGAGGEKSRRAPVKRPWE